MAVERANPLPRGVYWVDVIEKDFASFNAWLASAEDAVRVVKTTHTDATSFPYSEPAREWILFEVREPVEWLGPGLPTIASKGENTNQDDTVQRPPPEPDTDILDSLGKSALSGSIGLIVGIGVGLMVLNAFTRKGK